MIKKLKTQQNTIQWHTIKKHKNGVTWHHAGILIVICSALILSHESSDFYCIRNTDNYSISETRLHYITEAYSKPCKTSKMDRFFCYAKRSILAFWQGSDTPWIVLYYNISVLCQTSKAHSHGIATVTKIRRTTIYICKYNLSRSRRILTLLVMIKSALVKLKFVRKECLHCFSSMFPSGKKLKLANCITHAKTKLTWPWLLQR